VSKQLFAAQTANGNNQTLNAFTTIPAGKTGYLIYGKASTGEGKAAEVSYYGRSPGGVFNLSHKLYLYEGSYDYEFRIPSIIPEKTDLDVRGKNVQAGNIEVSAAFDILLVDN
jgi:hypothetical protein